MMRKLTKKKAGRRGAILVTVVFVLAFAVIFIAAAMMLTQSTRKRVYTEAESNQARLTVTSVAESWYRAIQKCEFDDDDILALCKANSGNGTTIRVKASANADTVPGIENEGSTNNESYTEVKMYRSPNIEGATKDEQYTYYADFSTHIDGQVENVRAALTYTPPVHTTDGAPFSTQIDLNGKFANNNLEVVGEGKNPEDLDNIFLVRKGGNSKDASFSSYATMIYCDGEVTFKDELFHSEDIVFLSGAKLKAGDSGHFKQSSNVKNFFFFGDNGESIAVSSDNGNFKGDGFNFYLCNRSNVSNWTSGGHVIYINADGTRVDGTSVSDAFKQKVQTYASYNASYKKGGKESFPTTETFLSSAQKKLKIGKTATDSRNADSTPTQTSLGDFLNTYHYKKYQKVVPPGAYYFTSDGSNHTDNAHDGLASKEPYVMVLQGGSTYRFWFKGGITFGLRHVVFIVDKPDKSAPVLFLMENGANINWPGDGSGTTTNGNTGGNGIFAVEGRNKTPQEAYDFVKGITANTPRQFENTSNKYSTRYDGKNEPCAMVLGMGNNNFSMDKNIIMEAFIGLFNDSYNDNGDPKSNVSFRNNDSGVLYGRIMTDGLGFSNDSGSILYPASPAASTLPGPNPDMEKVVTCFSLKSMIYYYQLGNNKTTP